MQPEDIRSLLSIDKHNLEDELLTQPDIMYRVGMEQAMAISRRDGQKESIKLLESEVAADMRTKTVKTTEKAIQEAVDMDEEVIKERNKLQELTAEARQWDVCYESVRARGYALHKLCDFALAEGASIVGQSEQRRQQEDADAQVQASMKSRRRRRVIEAS